MNKPQAGADSSRPYRSDRHGLPYLGPEALRAAKLRIRIQRMILSVDEHEKLARAESVEEKERLLNEFTERQKLQQTVAMTAYYPARPVVKQEKHINLAYPEWADKHYHGD